MAAQSFVFKLTHGQESKRFGYEGSLNSHALWLGLQERTRDLFQLKPGSFHLLLHDSDESVQIYGDKPIALKDYATFVSLPVQEILKRAQLDKKNRRLVKLQTVLIGQASTLATIAADPVLVDLSTNASVSNGTPPQSAIVAPVGPEKPDGIPSREEKAASTPAFMGASANPATAPSSQYPTWHSKNPANRDMAALVDATRNSMLAAKNVTAVICQEMDQLRQQRNEAPVKATTSPPRSFFSDLCAPQHSQSRFLRPEQNRDAYIDPTSRATFGQTTPIKSGLAQVAAATRAANNKPSPFASMGGRPVSFGPTSTSTCHKAVSPARAVSSGSVRDDHLPGVHVARNAHSARGPMFRQRDAPLVDPGNQPEIRQLTSHGPVSAPPQNKDRYQPSYINPMLSAPITQPRPVPSTNPFASDINVQKLMHSGSSASSAPKPIVSAGVCGEHRQKEGVGREQVIKKEQKDEQVNKFLARMTELVEDTFGAGLKEETGQSKWCLQKADVSEKECGCKTRKAEVTSPASKVTHNATCDLCESTITGTRYKCLTCPDWDACSNCYRAISMLHPTHTFVPLERAIAIPLPPTKPLHVGVKCDSCNRTIAGVRYKCTHQDCPDFDLCAACEALPVAVHPYSHNMLKIRERVKGGDLTFLQRAYHANELLVDADVQKYPCTLQIEVGADKKLQKVTVMDQLKPARELAASFVEDVTIPDGTLMHPNEIFTKIYRMRNTGKEAWPAGARLVFSANWHFSRQHQEIIIPQAQPGEVVDIELNALRAPGVEGNFVGLCTLQDENKTSFGDSLWISINVEVPRPVRPASKERAVSRERSQSREPSPHLSPKTGPELKAYFKDLLEKHETPQEAAERALTFVSEMEVPMPEPLASSVILPSAKAEHINHLQAIRHEQNTTPLRPAKAALDSGLISSALLDNTITVAPSAVFVKTFTIVNSGSEAWPEGTALVPVRGGRTAPVAVVSLRPGQQRNVSIELQAPSRADNGKFAKYFQLQANDQLFGEVFWIEIVVVDEASNPSSMSSSSIVLPTASTSVETPVDHRSAVTSPVSERSGNPFEDDDHSEFTSLADEEDDDFVMLSSDEDA